MASMPPTVPNPNGPEYPPIILNPPKSAVPLAPPKPSKKKPKKVTYDIDVNGQGYTIESDHDLSDRDLEALAGEVRKRSGVTYPQPEIVNPGSKPLVTFESLRAAANPAPAPKPQAVITSGHGAPLDKEKFAQDLAAERAPKFAQDAPNLSGLDVLGDMLAPLFHRSDNPEFPTLVAKQRAAVDEFFRRQQGGVDALTERIGNTVENVAPGIGHDPATKALVSNVLSAPGAVALPLSSANHLEHYRQTGDPESLKAGLTDFAMSIAPRVLHEGGQAVKRGLDKALFARGVGAEITPPAREPFPTHEAPASPVQMEVSAEGAPSQPRGLPRLSPEAPKPTGEGPRIRVMADSREVPGEPAPAAKPVVRPEPTTPPATAPQPAEPAAQPSPQGGVVVSVNGQRYHLTGEAEQIYNQNRADLQKRLDHITASEARGLDLQQAASQRKAAGMEFSADLRKQLGILTGKEESDALAHSAKARPGQKAMYGSDPVTIQTRPSFGKVKVQHEGGAIETVDVNDLTIEPTKPQVHPDARLLPEDPGPTPKAAPAPEAQSAPASAPKTPVAAPKTPVPPEAQATSNKQLNDLRKELGIDALPDAERQSFEKWMKGAQEKGHIERAHAIAQEVLADPKRILSAEETVGMAARLSNIKARVKELSRLATPDAAKETEGLIDEARTVTLASQASKSEAARSLVASQAAVTPEYDVVSLRNRATGLNDGLPLSDKAAGQVQGFAKRIDALESSLADIKRQIEQRMRAERARPVPGSPEKLRSVAMGTLRRMGLPTIEGGEASGMAINAKPGSRAGAISIPQSAQAQVRTAIRQLVRSYHATGATTLDEVVSRLQKDIPGISQDDALSLLDEQYFKGKIAANVAKREADRFLRGIQMGAEARTRPLIVRAMKAVAREISAVQRAVQTSLDLGATTIQGHKALFTSPGSVGKGFAESLKQVFSINTQEAFDRHMAGIKADAMYSRAIKAGVKFNEMGGSEFFGEALVNKFPGLFKSEAAFNAYRNKLRLEMFKAWSKGAPDDASHMAVIGDLVNVMTGTATGRVGKAVEHLGGTFYAPSYEASKWQYLMGQPLINSIQKTGLNSKATAIVARQYAINAAAFIGGVSWLKAQGADIDTDIRSADFGKLTLPGGGQIDLFGKAYSPLHTIAQQFYGNLTRGGKFQETDSYAYSPIEQYLSGKLAPLPKAIYNKARFGYQYNFDKGEKEAITLYDMDEGTTKPGSVIRDMAPMGVKGALKSNAVLGYLAWLEVIGFNTGEKKEQVGPGAPPLKLLPHGLDEKK